MISPKDMYCMERAAQLQESLGLSWKQSYAKAEEEWNASSNKLPDYDDDVSDLEGYIE